MNTRIKTSNVIYKRVVPPQKLTKYLNNGLIINYKNLKLDSLNVGNGVIKVTLVI